MDGRPPASADSVGVTRIHPGRALHLPQRHRAHGAHRDLRCALCFCGNLPARARKLLERKQEEALPAMPGGPLSAIQPLGLAQAGDVLGRGALGALDDVELDPLTLGERAEAAALDGAVVHEAILRPVLGSDEPEALGVVEPLDGTGGTHIPTPSDVYRLPRCGESVP